MDLRVTMCCWIHHQCSLTTIQLVSSLSVIALCNIDSAIRELAVSQQTRPCPTLCLVYDLNHLSGLLHRPAQTVTLNMKCRRYFDINPRKLQRKNKTGFERLDFTRQVSIDNWAYIPHLHPNPRAHSSRGRGRGQLHGYNPNLRRPICCISPPCNIFSF